MSAAIVDFELFQPHVWEGQRCIECGRYHVAILPLRNDEVAYAQCMFCGEMSAEAISPRFPFPQRRGQTVFQAARAMGMKV